METSTTFGLLCLYLGTVICCFLIAIAHRIELYSSESASCLHLSEGVVIKVGVALKICRIHTRAYVYAEFPYLV